MAEVRNSNSDDAGTFASAHLDHADHERVAAVYAPLLRQCPVQRITMQDGSSFKAVLGHPELEKVLKDPVTFSSSIVHFGDVPSIPIELDPPLHTHYRRILNTMINNTTVKSLEPHVRRYVVETVEALVGRGGGDIVPLAKSLPLRVLCRLLGVPDEDWKNLQMTQVDLRPGDLVLEGVEASQARMAGLAPVIAYAQKLVQFRRATPADDVVSKLLAAQVDGRPMTDQETVQIMMLLLLAGHETTGSAISGCVLLLARHKKVQDALRSDPQAIPIAIEECLRVEPPAQTLDRRVTADTAVAGQSLTAGETVLTFFGAANFDERVFDAAQDFIATRTPNRHMTFGRGIHACVGAPIARMELRIFLEELLARTQSFEIRNGFSRNKWPDIALKSLDVSMIASDPGSASKPGG